jgi:hypothetical protein
MEHRPANRRELPGDSRTTAMAPIPNCIPTLGVPVLVLTLVLQLALMEILVLGPDLVAVSELGRVARWESCHLGHIDPL